MSFIWGVISVLFLFVSYLTVVIKWIEWVRWYKYERVPSGKSVSNRLYESVYKR